MFWRSTRQSPTATCAGNSSIRGAALVAVQRPQHNIVSKSENGRILPAGTETGPVGPRRQSRSRIPPISGQAPVPALLATGDAWWASGQAGDCCNRVAESRAGLPDRKSVVSGESVSDRVDVGGGGIIKTKK